MQYRKAWAIATVVLLLVSVLSIRVLAQEADAEVRTGSRPDAPTYGVRGSYSVGTRDLVIDDEAPLDITVWYPALNEDNLEEAVIYPYEIKWDAIPGSMDVEALDWDQLPGGAVTVTGQAIREASFDLSDGPYPLVILSAGLTIGRTNYAWLAEHLASYGFVVIAPEHHEQGDASLSALWQSAVTRPQEILRVFAYIDEQVETGGSLEGLINPERVAVIGHSYGGYTALVAAGARFDISSFATLCENAREAGDPNVWLCDLILPYVNEMAELAGLDSTPVGLWPTWADLRVDAIVSMAGDAYLFGEAGLAEITVPVMALGGTLDNGTPYMWGTHPTYELVSSSTKARVAFNEAGHMIFAGTCEAIPWFTEIGLYEFCSDPVWDMNRAHDLINHFTTAFLLAELNQDTAAAAALAPDAVAFPGVTYEAQGF